MQALRLLPTNTSFPFTEISVTPYVPVPESNGEEWDRLESASALDVLIELAVHGEYNGLGGGSRTKYSLDLRTVAAAVFEVTKNVLVHGSHHIDSNHNRMSFARKKADRPSLKPCYHVVYNFKSISSKPYF